MILKTRTYLIKFNDMIVPDGEGKVAIVQPIEELEVDGATCSIYTGYASDYLHIKNVDGALVFSAEAHLIKWCKVRVLENQLKLIEK